VLAKRLANGDVAVALFNQGGSTTTISTTAAAIGKTGSSFTLRDLWTGATSTSSGAISATVPAHGTAVYRVSAGGTSTPPPSFRLRGEASGRCLDVNQASSANGAQMRHPRSDLGLQRRRQPAMDLQRQRHDQQRPERAVPGRRQSQHRQRHRRGPVELPRRRQSTLDTSVGRTGTCVRPHDEPPPSARRSNHRKLGCSRQRVGEDLLQRLAHLQPTYPA
jgi:hypothetical protein